MSDPTIRAYVDSRPVDVVPPATVLDAISAVDPSLGAAVIAGERTVMDSRGLPIAGDAPLQGGAILRVVVAHSREGSG